MKINYFAFRLVLINHFFCRWIESCIDEELPDVGTLEEELRHGVFLAKLACFFSPQTITMKKIYDRDLIRYRSSGLNFRHTDNINYFLKACKDVGLPKVSFIILFSEIFFFLYC